MKNSKDLFFTAVGSIKSNPTVKGNPPIDDQFTQSKFHGTTTIEDPESGHFVLIKKPAGKKWECWPEGNQFKIVKHPTKPEAYSWANAYLRKFKGTVKSNPGGRPKGPKKTGTIVCETCGEKFNAETTKTPNKKFCSKACLNKHRRITGVDLVTRKCVECGKKFEMDKSKNKDRVTCSRSCGSIVAWNEGKGKLASMKTKLRPCAQCGEKFRPHYGDKKVKYCSPDCRRAARPGKELEPNCIKCGKKKQNAKNRYCKACLPAAQERAIKKAQKLSPKTEWKAANDRFFQGRKKKNPSVSLGIKRPTVGIDEVDQDIQELIVDLYNDGHTIEQISKKVRLGLKLVRDVLIENKVTIRPAKPRKKENPRLLSVANTARQLFEMLPAYYVKLAATKDSKETVALLQHIIWLQGMFLFTPHNAAMTAMMLDTIQKASGLLDVDQLVRKTMKRVISKDFDAAKYLEDVVKLNTVASQVPEMFFTGSRGPVSYLGTLKEESIEYVALFQTLTPTKALLSVTNFIRYNKLKDKTDKYLKAFLLKEVVQEMGLPEDEIEMQVIYQIMEDQFEDANKMILESNAIIGSL